MHAVVFEGSPMNRALNVFLAFLRIAAGVGLLMAGIGKLGWFSSAEPLQKIFLNWQQHAPYAFVGKYVTLVQPHAGWMARVVVLGELGLGALLIVGFLTPVAALLAFIMVLQFYFASGDLFAKKFVMPGGGLTFLLTFLVLFAGRAGQSLGLDGLIGRSMQGGGPKK